MSPNVDLPARMVEARRPVAGRNRKRTCGLRNIQQLLEDRSRLYSGDAAFNLNMGQCEHAFAMLDSDLFICTVHQGIT